MNVEGFVNQGLREGDLSLRGDNKVSDAAIHRILKEAYEKAVRLRCACGSPRAFSPRDDKGVGTSRKTVKKY
jgi:hypothetical protein